MYAARPAQRNLTKTRHRPDALRRAGVRQTRHNAGDRQETGQPLAARSSTRGGGALCDRKGKSRRRSKTLFATIRPGRLRCRGAAERAHAAMQNKNDRGEPYDRWAKGRPRPIALAVVRRSTRSTSHARRAAVEIRRKLFVLTRPLAVPLGTIRDALLIPEPQTHVRAVDESKHAKRI